MILFWLQGYTGAIAPNQSKDYNLQYKHDVGIDKQTAESILFKRKLN